MRVSGVARPLNVEREITQVHFRKRISPVHDGIDDVGRVHRGVQADGDCIVISLLCIVAGVQRRNLEVNEDQEGAIVGLAGDHLAGSRSV